MEIKPLFLIKQRVVQFNVFLLSGAFPLRVSGVNYSSGRWMRSLKWLQPPGSKPKAKLHEKILD